MRYSVAGDWDRGTCRRGLYMLKLTFEVRCGKRMSSRVFAWDP